LYNAIYFLATFITPYKRFKKFFVLRLHHLNTTLNTALEEHDGSGIRISSIELFDSQHLPLQAAPVWLIPKGKKAQDE
jgi:site-specific recombinase XerC